MPVLSLEEITAPQPVEEILVNFVAVVVDPFMVRFGQLVEIESYELWPDMGVIYAKGHDGTELNLADGMCDEELPQGVVMDRSDKGSIYRLAKRLLVFKKQLVSVQKIFYRTPSEALLRRAEKIFKDIVFSRKPLPLPR